MKIKDIKDFVIDLISLKLQYVVIVFLFLVTIYRKLFSNDFYKLQEFFITFIPIRIIGKLSDVAIPLLKFFSFVSILGLVISIIFSLIVSLYFEKDIFSALVSNLTEYFPRSGIKDKLDSVFKFMFLVPSNFIIIILQLEFIFNNKNFDFEMLFKQHSILLYPVIFATGMFHMFFIMNLFINQNRR